MDDERLRLSQQPLGDRASISMPLGIGSTFSTEKLGARGSPCACQLTGPLAQSGGQAFRVLSDIWWNEGRRRLVVPGFLCESMLRPFENHNWSYAFFDFDENARPSLESFRGLTVEPKETAAVVAEYFGRVLTEPWRSEVELKQSLGLTVAEDRTHNLFDTEQSPADYTVASLRKLLPVGDGGVVTGSDLEFEVSNKKGPGDDYWDAMEAKAQLIAGEADEITSRFRRAEARFESELRPRRATNRTTNAIPRLDIARMVKRRVENAESLMELVPSLDIVNHDWGAAPSHLVVRDPDPKWLQSKLAQRVVFCPIHWPRPPQMPQRVPWFNNLLSLPIDHRYNRSHMEYIAAALKSIRPELG